MGPPCFFGRGCRADQGRPGEFQAIVTEKEASEQTAAAAARQRRPALFIYTNSYDLSADVIVRRLGNDAVFRFNLDLWHEYVIDIDRRQVVIANASGRAVDSQDIAKFLWRKPLTNQQLFPDRDMPRERAFQEEELAYAMREVWNAMYLSGRAVLIDPVSDSIAGKLIQAQIASGHFQVPDWAMVCGASPRLQADLPPQVAKSLTSLRTGDRSVLYTTRVNAKQLSPASPWLLQAQVAADHDVTVVVVRDALFAFALSRADFPAGTVDWRRARALTPAQAWVPHALPPAVAAAIRRFMADMSLHYGRLDFLLAGEDYFFLEVNPNGEWGWLDPSGETGILDALASELSPDTPCHPLPNPRRINVADRLNW